jgi:rRNA maturation endonuclease Nob1
MGLFNELGRQVEQVKQSVQGSDGDPAYQCRACDARLDAAHDFCPECGEDAVEPLTAE